MKKKELFKNREQWFILCGEKERIKKSKVIDLTWIHGSNMIF